MKCTVILTEDKNGIFYAKAPNIPDCFAKAKTRNEAISKIQDAIAKFISRSEIIQLDVSAEPKSGALHHDTPWELFGAFKNDPNWESLFDEIEQQRTTN